VQWTKGDPTIVKPRRTRVLFEQGLGWLLAVLATLVGPSALWHEATTVHAVCPDHGEILDAGHDVPVSAAPVDGPSWTQEESGEGAHEECAFVALSQPSSPTSAPPPAGVFLQEAGGADAPGSEVRFVSIPLLLLAPKQSPPV
jgi:hypothetical protein